MEFVAKDKGGDWYFDGNKVYWCVNSDGQKVGKIYAEYIPDPVLLWQSKCASAGIHMSSLEAKALKSNDVVYKLWEHKHANANNALQPE